MIREVIAYANSHIFLWFLFVIAGIITLSITVPHGQYGCYEETCGFVLGENWGDSIAHLGISTTAFKTVPFQNPFFAGEDLQGYHYLPNLIMYLLSFVGIPVAFSFYKLLPVVYFLALSVLALYFILQHTRSPFFVGVFMFFVYFGTTLTVYFSLYHYGTITREFVMIPLMQSSRALKSIHYAFSVVFMFWALIILHAKKLSMRDLLVLSLIVFVSFGSKFYGGAILLCILTTDQVIRFLQNRNSKQFIIAHLFYGVAAVLAITVFYKPFSSGLEGSAFIFQPFEIVHHVLEDKYLFYSENLVNAWYFLIEAGGFSPRLIAIEALAFVLFIVYYFGVRIVGFITIAYLAVTRKMQKHETILTVAILVSIVLSVLLIQRGDWFNTIQFLPYATLLIGYFVAKGLYNLYITKTYVAYGVLGLFILLSAPSNIAQLYEVSSKNIIVQEEVEALRVLRELPEGTVFTFPVNITYRSYIPALAHKPTYISFEHVLKNWGVDYAERADILDQLYEDELKFMIGDVDARYFYLRKKDEKYAVVRNKMEGEGDVYENIFENDAVVMFEGKYEMINEE